MGLLASNDRGSNEKIMAAIAAWLRQLNDIPGWSDWKRQQMAHSLLSLDGIKTHHEPLPDFDLPCDLELQREILDAYLELCRTFEGLRDVEWYFRRYPFSSAPVSYSSHMRNSCELYFGKVYQFKDRVKILSKKVRIAYPDFHYDFGQLIKLFSNKFDLELRHRNRIHHNELFDDFDVQTVNVSELLSQSDEFAHLSLAGRAKYKKFSQEWAKRVRDRSKEVDIFLDAIAAALLVECEFLTRDQTPG